jgi:hypothetical protein
MKKGLSISSIGGRIVFEIWANDVLVVLQKDDNFNMTDLTSIFDQHDDSSHPVIVSHVTN